MTESDNFTNDYNANHTEQKLYTLEIEKANTLKYIKDEIQDLLINIILILN